MSIDFSDTGFETQEPLVTTSLTRDDENEGSLRPKTLREYIGQEKAKGNLEVFIQAAKMRGEPLDHVLLHGPPGLGKTTLSGIIANEMAIGMINQKTTAVRLIPVIGKGVGETVEFGGLLGYAPVMPVNQYSCEKFVNRGGRIPAPIHSFKN